MQLLLQGFFTVALRIGDNALGNFRQVTIEIALDCLLMPQAERL
jgi:hypothetical protein